MTHSFPRDPGNSVLRLASPSDILSAIPYLLRFHPDDSIVFMVLSGGRLVVTARLDIGLDVGFVADKIRTVCSDQGGDEVILAAYAADQRTGADAIDDLMDAIGTVSIVDALVTDGSRWWSRLCDGPCCPPQGTPFDPAVGPVVAGTDSVRAPALPDRAALKRSVAGPDPEQTEACRALCEEALIAVREWDAAARRDRMALLVEDYCLHPRQLTDRECAELAVLAYDIDVRDIAAQRIRLSDAEEHVALWEQVVRRAVAPFESAPLCLLGLAAWVFGNGALQVVCMERAERINPDYSLLGVLEQINTRCLSPSTWQEMHAA